MRKQFYIAPIKKDPMKLIHDNMKILGYPTMACEIDKFLKENDPTITSIQPYFRQDRTQLFISYRDGSKETIYV